MQQITNTSGDKLTLHFSGLFKYSYIKMSGAHVGHCRSPYRQWPATGKTLKNHIFPLYSLIKAFLNNNTVSFSLFPTLKPYLYLILAHKHWKYNVNKKHMFPFFWRENSVTYFPLWVY